MTAKRRTNGTFAKGVSGNPGGRPKEVGQVRELAQEHTEDAIKTLTTIMGDGKAPAAGRVAAANAILDRGWGKPLQSNRHEFEGANPWEELLGLVRDAPTEHLERVVEELGNEQTVEEAQRIHPAQDD